MDAMSIRPWHIMSVLWRMLTGILLPLPLRPLGDFLRDVLRHLLRRRDLRRPRQLDRLRKAFSSIIAWNPG